MKLKKVSKVVLSKWQSEGRGARVRRSIGRPELRNLDPFLLLDEFEGSAADGAGFPDHPHRGFETVSYLLEGEFTHEDFAGYSQQNFISLPSKAYIERKRAVVASSFRQSFTDAR